MKRFDAKFGDEFLASVPHAPGVYRMFDAKGVLIYVGKAKDLRRRLAQYRNAGRTRRDAKMRKLIQSAARIAFEVRESELDASLEEVRLIQTERPRANVAAKFSFLYPYVGLTRRGGDTHFCFTTVPERFEGYRFHGAFRSRETTGGAFFALMRLIPHLAHPMPRRELGGEDQTDYSYAFGFRRLALPWVERFDALFRGEHPGVLAELSTALLEKASARARAAEIAEDLRALKAFWLDEAKTLRAAVTATGFEAWPVPRTERDPLFLKFRARDVA